VAVARKHHLDVDIVVGREQGPVKPDAYGVLHICDYLNVEPAQTLVVGDYLFDLLCARAAGATAVLLLTNPEARVFADRADFTIENLEKVLHIIDHEYKTTAGE
jgi:phosphoglycolate phosphatase-like HAD superfamily hydrolase